jgi:cytochrome c-type biogenesis protein
MDLSSLATLKDFPLLYAFAIGLITALGPCPLSANVAAIAYVSSKLADSRSTVIAGAMYTAGRALTYTVIGLLIFMFGSTVMDNAPSLQDYDKIILAPVLVLAGVVMLGLWKPNISVGDGLKAKYGLKLSEKGILGAFGLGAVFALAFCPYTAVMFFGLLMPFALTANATGMSFMAVFGVGTGLPVLVFAVLLGISASFAKAYIAKIVRFEPYLRKTLGAGFILYGLYLFAEYMIVAIGV